MQFMAIQSHSSLLLAEFKPHKVNEIVIFVFSNRFIQRVLNLVMHKLIVEGQRYVLKTGLDLSELQETVKHNNHHSKSVLQ